MNNFDMDDFLSNPYEGKTWSAWSGKNDFNDFHNQAKEAANAWKNNINNNDYVNKAKEAASNWNNNIDSNMRSLANTAKTACNLLSGEQKKQCEKAAENNGMATQVLDKSFEHPFYWDKNAVSSPNFNLL